MPIAINSDDLVQGVAMSTPAVIDADCVCVGGVWGGVCNSVFIAVLASALKFESALRDSWEAQPHLLGRVERRPGPCAHLGPERPDLNMT